MDTKKIDLAIQLAEYVHRNQKYGYKEYVYHLRAVDSIMDDWIHSPECVKSKAFTNDDIVVMTYLHDAIEDTLLTKETIANLFGEFVADCVDLMTDPNLSNRKEKKEAANKKFALVKDDYQIALIVKAADRLANVQACIDLSDTRLIMYKKEHEEFKKAAFRDGWNNFFFEEMDKILEEK